MAATRPRVLVAANLRALETMHRILGRDLEGIPALSSKATLHGLERKVHMVIVEHSRMLLLLEALSSKRAPKAVPAAAPPASAPPAQATK